MKTSDLEQVISAYVDGEIPEDKRAAVERLVQKNEQAAACYSEFMRIREGLRALPTVALPSDFATGLVAAIKQRQTPVTSSGTKGKRPAFRAQRLVFLGTVSLCVVVAAVLFSRFMLPGVSTSSGRTTAMVPAQVESDTHATAPVTQSETANSQPVPVAARNNKTETTKKENTWMTAPVPLAVQKNAAQRITKPTLDALLWIRCTPVASQEKILADEFAKYCMSKSLNFTATGQHVYEFKMTRPDFADFVQWLRQNPLTGGDVQMSDALNGWVTGQTFYSVPLDPALGTISEVQTIPMADELSIRLQINMPRQSP
ncbi:MAG: RseA family anti-sigma factor [Thermoguttaceae bacterium]|nr:RseA family anti-sigma factor [Thermoguttaceae bacterium]